ncbi:small integral membrane protein 26 [Cavia porcellus]|uniref:small integral membrane protein 26 n=1 Tax=Cavia porcellus TaxID=10141 RepID=UPI000C878413|nr:small integral membrane protein 26-like [Cavia porcellus]
MHRGRDASFPLVVVADIAARWPEVPPPPCGEQFGPSRRGAMQPWQALAWYRRMSLVYGLGAWTVFGTMFYFYGKNKEEPLVSREVEQKDLPRDESGIVLEPLKGFYVERSVVYIEDYVPLTERIHNTVKKWTGDSGSKP